MQRRAEFRPFSWLNDLWKRDQLDLSPPYQRRSVWSDRFRADFITTVLMNYPCPAIFLFEEIRPDGSFFYRVVDGKQRLTTLLDFVTDKLSIDENYPTMALRGRYFSQLDDEAKLSVWRYAFSVEFVEQENEALINDIFNRINKNVAKLSQQELRHALFSGLFISAAEDLTTFMDDTLPTKFPNIAGQSKRQMKDVENVATMLLFIENGERGLSQADMDDAFASREETWDQRDQTIASFRSAVGFIAGVLAQADDQTIISSRMKNQADFYSFFAAVAELQEENLLPTAKDVSDRLKAWLAHMRAWEREELPDDPNQTLSRYLAAARAASNDAGPRRTRITILKDVMRGG